MCAGASSAFANVGTDDCATPLASFIVVFELEVSVQFARPTLHADAVSELAPLSADGVPVVHLPFRLDPFHEPSFALCHEFVMS